MVLVGLDGNVVAFTSCEKSVKWWYQEGVPRSGQRRNRSTTLGVWKWAASAVWLQQAVQDRVLSKPQSRHKERRWRRSGPGSDSEIGPATIYTRCSIAHLLVRHKSTP